MTFRRTLTFHLVAGDLSPDFQEAAEQAASEILMATGIDPVMAQTYAGFPAAYESTGDPAFRMNSERWTIVEIWECAERAACAAAGVSERMGRLTNYPELIDAERQRLAPSKAGESRRDA